jgi:phosphoribosylformimino-5-aminoimidazole carboxamide ribotide isomerase
MNYPRAGKGADDRMRIIPALDLRGGKCVRLTQGRRTEARVYDADPVEVALKFEADGASMLHVVDLDGAFAESHSMNRDLVRRIVRAVNIPVQVGGGLRSAEDITEIISAGAMEVVVGTVAAKSPELLESFVKHFGTSIVVGIAARNGQVLTEGWEKTEDMAATDLARRVASAGVERIIYTDTARDGTLTGINIEQTCALARESKLKVTAAGGLASLSDIERLRKADSLSVDSVIIGRALYDGIFTLKEAQQA